MAFWFNKKKAPQKVDHSHVQPVVPAPATTQAVPSSSFASSPEEKPLLKLLVKPGAVPVLKAIPPATPPPVPIPVPDPVRLKVRPKVDQRALYQQLMNSLYDAVFILDERGNVMESNIRVDELLGYTHDEAWDLPITTVIPGMNRQLFEHLKKNLVGNQHILIDSRCFRKDGSSFTGEVGVCNITFMHGNNIIFTIRNIERRKNTLVDIKKLQVAIDHSLSPMFICNEDETFTIANQLALDLFGLQTILDGKTVKLTHLLPQVAGQFAEAANGNASTETLSLHRQDVSVTFKLSLTPIKNGDEIIGVAGSILLV